MSTDYTREFQQHVWRLGRRYRSINVIYTAYSINFSKAKHWAES